VLAAHALEKWSAPRANWSHATNKTRHIGSKSKTSLRAAGIEALIHEAKSTRKWNTLWREIPVKLNQEMLASEQGRTNAEQDRCGRPKPNGETKKSDTDLVVRNNEGKTNHAATQNLTREQKLAGKINPARGKILTAHWRCTWAHWVEIDAQKEKNRRKNNL
jgi:hypothetical protein